MKKLFTLFLLLAFVLLANMSLVTADHHGWWASAGEAYAGTTIRGVSESTPALELRQGCFSAAIHRVHRH